MLACWENLVIEHFSVEISKQNGLCKQVIFLVSSTLARCSNSLHWMGGGP